MNDYYAVLGVQRTATKEEIKAAYKKRALTTHPDRGGNEEDFKKVNKAYTILSDDQKRKRYDMTGQDDDQPQPSPPPFGFNPFQFMGDVFGNRQRQQTRKPPTKADNMTTEIKVSLEQAYFGTNKQIKVSRQNRCNCERDCVACHGSGVVIQNMQAGPFIMQNSVVCRSCQEGMTYDYGCASCKGKGWIESSKQLDVVVPKGVDASFRCEVPDLGHAGKRNCDPPGNLILKISIDPHPLWKVDGADFKMEMTLSFWDSVIGKVVSIPHFDGPIDVDLRDIGIIPNNYEHKIFGKGFKPGGSCVIKFRIEYTSPSRLPDEAWEKIVEAKNYLVSGVTPQ